MLAQASRSAFGVVARPVAVAPRVLATRTLATKPPQPPKDDAPPRQSAQGGQPGSASSSSSSSKSDVDATSPPPPAESATPETSSTQRRPGTSAFDIDTTLTTIAEDAAGGDASRSGGRTGARARSDRAQSSIEQSRKFWWRLGGLAGVSLLGLQVAQLGREWDTVRDRERFAEDPRGESYFGRMQLRIRAMYDDWNAPVWEKLLPDPLPFPYSRPYTLLVDLDQLLIHSHWTREHGWRTAKRPGLDYFLGYLGQFFEVVLYTTQPYYAIAPILEKLDPDRRLIGYTLFRESCRTLKDGRVVKDLSALNRDISKVLVLDTEPDRCSHPGNVVLLHKWDGAPRDRELIELLPFLEAIGIYNAPDVRTVLQAYEGKHVPTEFNERQRQVEEKRLADWRAKKSGGGGGGGGLASMAKGFFGGSSTSSGSSADRPPKEWIETQRELYQKAYAEDLKFWEENGEAMRKQAKEDQERQMKEMKLSVFDLMSGKQFQPPQQGQ
ncbi:unnamed protein product [Jaminaea pallidilutea]